MIFIQRECSLYAFTGHRSANGLQCLFSSHMTPLASLPNLHSASWTSSPSPHTPTCDWETNTAFSFEAVIELCWCRRLKSPRVRRCFWKERNKQVFDIWSGQVLDNCDWPTVSLSFFQFVRRGHVLESTYRMTHVSGGRGPNATRAFTGEILIMPLTPGHELSPSANQQQPQKNASSQSTHSTMRHVGRWWPQWPHFPIRKRRNAGSDRLKFKVTLLGKQTVTHYPQYCILTGLTKHFNILGLICLFLPRVR